MRSVSCRQNQGAAWRAKGVLLRVQRAVPAVPDAPHDGDEWAKSTPEAREADPSMPPLEYVKHNCYFTWEADEPPLGRAIEEIGEAHVLMTTDYPHFDSEWPHTVAGIHAGRHRRAAEAADPGGEPRAAAEPLSGHGAWRPQPAPSP